MHHRRFLWAGLFAFVSIFISSQLFAQGDVVEKRQKLMKSNGAASKALKRAVEEKDYATVELKAKEIAGNMDKVLDLFPKGSTSEKSRSKPEIWDRWDEFSKVPAKVKVSALELGSAAAAKDEAQVRAKFETFSKACGSCHKAFRKEVKKNGG
jgi:cytochrome c556